MTRIEDRTRRRHQWFFETAVLAVILWMAASAAVAQSSAANPLGASTIKVDCNKKGSINTTLAMLSRAGKTRDISLLVSGTCHENVTIEALENLSLQGNPTATIDGSVNPDLATVTIGRSVNIALSNLTIIGSNLVGVDCESFTYCSLTEVTLQNNDVGANAADGARLAITNSTIQNNTEGGVELGFGSAYLNGGSIVGNGGDGVILGKDATLTTAGRLTIQNNNGNGITTEQHNTIGLGATTITGNTGDGISLRMASTLIVSGSTISNNAGHQVRIGDLSIAQFNHNNTVTPDVVCDPVYSATRGIGNLIGTTTNCPAELPPTP